MEPTPISSYKAQQELAKPFTTALKVGLGFAVAGIIVLLAAFLLGLGLISANSGGSSSDTGGVSQSCDDGSTPTVQDGGLICSDGSLPS